MSAAQIMDHAEKLYQKGFVSYPRTETNKFPSSMNDGVLKNLIQLQFGNQEWGQYAQELINNNKYQHPRSGTQNDEAHPPIHPTKGISRQECESDHKQIENLMRNLFQ
ncbi:DNA topoisomerase, type IA, core domain [Pseudocohnilembus persalinus]|uniref:DNA topoisomerase n=1 Tax=Pseudocohnilembus persalinus TaxID=266149 RepID=A0A0V0QVB8_PSEPJ|nr:DNA topoisomerase, type IA, core domain [Pseudocohnilembus persalinus]|eukprot:KRX06029.1 DNA topoisomerase, type IA, core domain [Pseudocohnilembus persalinus]